MTCGFLNLCKPAGFTSHDCVARVRRLTRCKRTGHGGTLDPMAIGVLPIALGPATRLLQFLPGAKAYEATVRFGITTATDDLEGEVLTQRSPAELADLSSDRAIAVLPQFIGTITQIPPKYSAIQVDGQRLYDLARQGKAVEVPARQVLVESIALRAWRSGDYPEADVAIVCGPGTYIRSIARDWGAALGTGATLASLKRTLSGGFDLQDSLTLEQLEQAISDGWQPLDPAPCLTHLPTVVLTAEQVPSWFFGRAIALAELPADLDKAIALKQDFPEPIARVLDGQGHLLGVGNLTLADTGAIVAPRVVLPAPSL
jgi:tRNA pseudouridine55 synthase